MNLEFTRDRLARILKESDMKVVFAESCTAGLCSAFIGQHEGISKYLCGSVVTYRPQSKIDWLQVNKDTIKEHSCESMAVAEEMAIHVLEKTTEANFSAAVVGDISGYIDDCMIYVAIYRNPHVIDPVGGRIPVKDFTSVCTLKEITRENRQREAVQIVYESLHQCIKLKD